MRPAVFEEGAGLLRRDDRRVVEVGGADRVDYLHRMLSQDVARLAAGEAADACVLTPQGRLVGVPTVLHAGHVHWLDLDAQTVADVVARLERTVITEDVTFRDLGAAVGRYTLVGAGAPVRLRALVDESPDPGRHVVRSGVRVLRRDLGTCPAYELFVTGDGADAVLADSAPVAAADWDALRVAERVPAWGAELGPEAMPLEVGLGETAVSFTKGCYPGQEPVSMAHHRGHPAKVLVRVALEGGAPGRGDELSVEGRTVGRLTTVAGDRALATVRWDRVEEGAVLALAGGGTARILDPR